LIFYKNCRKRENHFIEQGFFLWCRVFSYDVGFFLRTWSYGAALQAPYLPSYKSGVLIDIKKWVTYLDMSVLLRYGSLRSPECPALPDEPSLWFFLLSIYLYHWIFTFFIYPVPLTGDWGFRGKGDFLSFFHFYFIYKNWFYFSFFTFSCLIYYIQTDSQIWTFP
jgi:hypothetical protein